MRSFYATDRRTDRRDQRTDRRARITRVVLSQLRSNFCARLKDYQLRIGKSQDDICPACQLEAQAVRHLFDCPARPTTLAPVDLWNNPWAVADFIRTIHCFADLPRPTPPPPRRCRAARPPPDPPDSPVSTASTLVTPFSDFSFHFDAPTQALRDAESVRDD